MHLTKISLHITGITNKKIQEQTNIDSIDFTRRQDRTFNTNSTSSIMVPIEKCLEKQKQYILLALSGMPRAITAMVCVLFEALFVHIE